MASRGMNKVIDHLRGIAQRQEATGKSDRQLLECFVGQRDEAAFAVLVRRHAALVWGVCRRVLASHHDAEDAFQATFLVLVRKASSIASRELLANWLYGVAHRTALKARAATRHRRERHVDEMPEPPAQQQDVRGDLLPLLDQELSRLPDKHRRVVILCDLEGKTRKEAARLLRLPEGTVASRLTRARALLAKRLARHGLPVSGGTVAAVWSQNAASASVPASLVVSTIKAATLLAAGQTAVAAGISAKVATLTEGVVHAMFLGKLKITLAVLLILASGIIFGGGLFWHQKAVGQTSPSLEGVVQQSTKDAGPAQKVKGQKATDAGVQKKDEKPAPADEPKIADIWSAYYTNRAAFDEKYENKQFTFSGGMSCITKAPPKGEGLDRFKGCYLLDMTTNQPSDPFLGENGSRYQVTFVFDATDRKLLAELKPGQPITIEGKCQIHKWEDRSTAPTTIREDFFLTDCKIIKVGEVKAKEPR